MNKPYKFRIERTKPNVMVQFSMEGTFKVQSVYYSSVNPSSHVTLYDKDGDIVSFPIPGQIDPKLTNIDPVTINLPLSVVDEEGGNQVVIHGELNENNEDTDEDTMTDTEEEQDNYQ